MAWQDKRAGWGTLYHISPARNRESIAQEGLRLPGQGSPYLWVLDDYRAAQELAQKQWGGSRDNDIWSIHGHGLDLQPDPHPGGQEGIYKGRSYILSEPVHPSRVSLIPHQATANSWADISSELINSDRLSAVPDYEIRPADEGWFNPDGQWVPRQMSGRDTLQTAHGQGEGQVAYLDGQPVASVTWQRVPGSPPDAEPWGGSLEEAGRHWCGSGGCAAMALAMQQRWPHLGIKARTFSGGLDHAYAHDGRQSYDIFGHESFDPRDTEVTPEQLRERYPDMTTPRQIEMAGQQVEEMYGSPRIMLGSAYTHPDHRRQGLFNRLSEPLRASGEPVDAFHWENPWLKNKVRDWRLGARFARLKESVTAEQDCLNHERGAWNRGVILPSGVVHTWPQDWGHAWGLSQ